MIKPALLLLLSLPATAALAQQGGQPGQAVAYSQNQYLMMAKPVGAMRGVKGSPYADKRWLPARLVMSNNAPFDPMVLKYDVLNSRILMRQLNANRADSLQLDDFLLTQFELSEPATADSPARTRVFRRFVEAAEPRQRREYVEVLHQGQFALLKRYVKVIRPGSSTGLGDTDNQILTHEEYYLVRPDASLAPVKLSAKSLASAAPSLAETLKTDAAAKKARSEADWSAVLASLDPKK